MARPARPAAAADGSGRMFDGIARRYDLLNALMSLGLAGRWRRRLVAALALPPRAHVCDVACGTADVGLAVVAACPGARVVGVDPSAKMLEVAAEKLRRRTLDGQVRLLPGDACELPFGGATFDACTIAFGIRNIADRLAALREMARVCRPGRPVAVLELAEPHEGPLAAAARLHIHHIAPTLGSWLSGSREYRYLSRSIAAFPPPQAFAELMRQAGLRDVSVQPLCLGALHLYVGRTPAAAAAR